MQSEKRVEIAVGLVVFAGILVLVLGILWGKGMDWISQKVIYTIQFNDVHGLEIGDPVMIRGIQQGKVREVELSSKQVLVRFWLKPENHIYTDYIIHVENREIMGGKQLTINPGSSGELVQSSNYLYGEEGGDPIVLIADLSRTLVRADSLLFAMNTAIDPEQIQSSISQLNQTARDVSLLMNDSRRHLQTTMNHLNYMVEQIESDSTIHTLGNVMRQVDSTMVQTQDLIAQMQDSTSTFGKLTYESVLYDDLLQSVHHLDSLITDIQKNPRRYIHVEIF